MNSSSISCLSHGCLTTHGYGRCVTHLYITEEILPELIHESGTGASYGCHDFSKANRSLQDDFTRACLPSGYRWCDSTPPVPSDWRLGNVENISMANLQGTPQLISRRCLRRPQQNRPCPSTLPFTEPSVEVDVSCFPSVAVLAVMSARRPPAGLIIMVCRPSARVGNEWARGEILWFALCLVKMGSYAPLRHYQRYSWLLPRRYSFSQQFK